jgi:hypothetical protein
MMLSVSMKNDIRKENMFMPKEGTKNFQFLDNYY